MASPTSHLALPASSFVKGWLAVFLLLSAGFPARAGEPGCAAEVPDWALAALSIRDVGATLEKVGAYADKLLPNSAELAKQMSMSALFNLPMEAGLKNDGIATIFALDPVATGMKDERAFILPVGDVAALKTALVNTYGVPTEAGGVMNFVLPQPLPQPDKNLAVKLVPGKLLAAPSAAFLRKLEEFVTDNPAGPLAKVAPKGATLPDVVLTLKVSSLKRNFGPVLETSLEAGAAIAGGNGPAAEQLKARVKNITDGIWQLDAVEAHLEFDQAGSRAALEIRVLPSKGSALAKVFSVPATAADGKLLRLLPAEPALALVWNMNGTQLVDWFRAELAKQTQARRPEAVAVAGSLLDLLQLAQTDMAMALGGSGNDGAALMLAMQSSDAASTGPGLTALLQALQKLMDAAAAAGGAPASLKPLAGEDCGGVILQRYQLDGPPAPPANWGELLGWPLSFQYGVVGGTLALSTGKAGLGALKQTVANTKTPPAADKDSAAAVAGALPAGTFAASLIYPVRVVKLGFALVPPDLGLDIGKVTAGVTDSPAVFSLRQTENLAALRLELPAAVPHAVYTMAQRIEGARARQRRAQAAGQAPAPAPETVPAPPPAQ